MHNEHIPLLLERNGSFYVAPCAEDSTQCGFKRGDREVWYHAEIESSSVCLDSDGFVLDNNAIQRYFDETYGSTVTFPSCENIALRAVFDLRDLMGHDRCLSVKVQIRPGNHAGITAEKRFHAEPPAFAPRGWDTRPAGTSPTYGRPVGDRG